MTNFKRKIFNLFSGDISPSKIMPPLTTTIFIISIYLLSLPLSTRDSLAITCPEISCSGCGATDPIQATNTADNDEDNNWQPLIEMNIEDHLNSEENWIVEEFFENFWVKALAELTEFLGAFGMYQVEVVGTFFDARNQIETHRLFFQLHADAHRDYQPSDDFCWFGTNSRSLAASEGRANLNMLSMSKRALERHVGHKNSASALSRDEDKNSRWAKFIKTYCDPKDNAWSRTGQGLDLACDRDGVGGLLAAGATDKSRINLDIDYTALIDEPRTLNVNFSTTASFSDDEEDVMAMASNLYGNNILSRRLASKIAKPEIRRLYMDLRSIEAKRNVAENSYNAIVSLKSSGTSGSGGGIANPDVGSFMSSLIKDIMPAGTSNDEVISILGGNPSYYAQLEFLSKKIYQNPDFFANLYDSTANIKRKSTAMKAINLLLDRTLYESELRQEMLLSVMLSSKLNDNYRTVNRDMAQDHKDK